MPTRRLVVALTVLLLGVFGVGIVTALSRVGDDPDPTAQPSPSVSQSPLVTSDPSTAPPTETPEPTDSPTPEPTATVTGGPTVAPGGTASPGAGNGGGGVPNMPNTGAPVVVVVAATALAGSAALARRVLAQ